MHLGIYNSSMDAHLKSSLNIRDQIWENPPYGIRAQFTQSVFLVLVVAQIENGQSPDFVICDRIWENPP